MGKRDYHFCFRNMDRKHLGMQVMELINSSDNMTVFIYEIIASVIIDLEAQDLPADGIKNAVDLWIEKKLYNKETDSGFLRQSPVPCSGFEDDSHDAGADTNKNKGSFKAGGVYGIECFMGHSKFSDLTGGK